MSDFTEEEEMNVSSREQQIIARILEGLPNKTIAEQLFISERTVKFHCSNIYQKCNVQNRCGLILKPDYP